MEISLVPRAGGRWRLETPGGFVSKDLSDTSMLDPSQDRMTVMVWGYHHSTGKTNDARFTVEFPSGMCVKFGGTHFGTPAPAH
jgi:hypothetical protein